MADPIRPTPEQVDALIKRITDLKPNNNKGADELKEKALKALKTLKDNPNDKDAIRDLEDAAKAMQAENVRLGNNKPGKQPAPVVAGLTKALNEATAKFPRVATPIDPAKIPEEVKEKIAAIEELKPNGNPTADKIKAKALDALKTLKDKPDDAKARKALDEATTEMRKELANVKGTGRQAPVLEKLVEQLQDISDKLPPPKAPTPKGKGRTASADGTQREDELLYKQAKDALAGIPAGMLGGFSEATTAPAQQVAKADPNKGKEPVNPLIQQSGKRSV